MIESVLDFLLKGPLTVWVWLIAPIIVFVRSLSVLRLHPPAIKIISSLMFAAASSYFIFFTSLSWALRDGTGGWPEGVDGSSHGIRALGIFIVPFILHSVIAGVIAGFAFALCSGGIEQNEESGDPATDTPTLTLVERIQHNERGGARAFVRDKHYYKKVMKDESDSS